jgi:hypothetical protein
MESGDYWSHREGDYGHGHELIFNEHANIDVVAIADPDATGAQVPRPCKATRQYGDYREMLERKNRSWFVSLRVGQITGIPPDGCTPFGRASLLGKAIYRDVCMSGRVAR